MGGLAVGRSSLWITTALTGAAFAALHRVGWLGELPLPIILGLLVVSAGASALAQRVCGDGSVAWQLHVSLAVRVFGSAAIIYAIGWGPLLALGYVFVVADSIEEFGARAWKPSLLWIAVATVGGQVAVAAGAVHMYLGQPEIHVLAGLSLLGVVFVVYVVGTKTAEHERSSAQLRELFAANPQPMFVVDVETLAFLEVNEAAVQCYGYSRNEFLARRLTDIRPPEDVPQFLAGFADRPAGVKHLEARHVLKDGGLIDVDVSAHELKFEARRAVLAVIQDVTQRNALEAELRHRAFHDPLTNLANRALFLDRVESALRRRSRVDGFVAVLVADLDGFKTVNDSLGHTAGDALLVGVAERFRAALRTVDTAARLGGDEFAILVEDFGNADEAGRIASRLMDSLAEPIHVAGQDVIIHVSIGIDLTNAPDHSADALLRNADTAMYRAKADGRGCSRFFEAAMHAAAIHRMDLEQALRRAIENDELMLHYQPVVSIRSGRVVSLEALARWCHPTKGIIPPLDFIPLAEETGLIVDIGRWVTREACRQTKAWRVAMPDRQFTMAVNVSRRQLANPDFVHLVASSLAESGLDASTLTLEITESVLAGNPDVARQRLQRLREIGVGIAIDDFGTGYSSLSTLRDLPVNTLKIDKVFIDDLIRERDSADLVRAIVQLARSLGLTTIAEGVETPEQLRRLEELGCDQFQGYLFCRPLPADGLHAFLMTQPDQASARA